METDVKSLNYFEWLCYLVKEENQSRADILDHIRYTWYLEPNKNRAYAGLLLRKHYSELYGVYLDDISPDTSNASVFEVLVALAMDFSSSADIPEDVAYHEMISNMSLNETSLSNIEPRVRDWMNGNLNVYGSGGPFPLYHYAGDVTHLTLWDQMNTYISERYPLDKNWID